MNKLDEIIYKTTGIDENAEGNTVLYLAEVKCIARNYAEQQLKNCNLQNVSGLFSSDKLEQAYKDGVRDALAKGYGTFDEENYR